MNSDSLISVVFSFRNEEETLPELIRRVESALEQAKFRYEIIFVNDCSTDASLEVLKLECQRNPNIRIINLSRNFGFGPALLCGLEHTKGDAVVYLDSDLQDPPELIPKMASHWASNGYDVVHTRRVSRKGEGRIKMAITKIAYKAINKLSELQIQENVGDYKLLSRRVVDQIMKIKEKDPFTRGLPVWVGFDQVTIDYEREARFAGKTHFSLLRSVAPYLEFVRGMVAFSVWPLYFSLLVGLTVSFGSFCYMTLIIMQRVFFGTHLPGWPAMMAAVLFLGGVILMSLGVVGIYIGKIFDEVRERPRYIVESLVGFEDSLSSNDPNASQEIDEKRG